VGKARFDVSTVRLKAATTPEALNAALDEFSETAAHW